MKRRYTVLLAIVFLVLFYTNVFIYSNNATAKPNTSAYGDVEYVFENDNLYNSTNPFYSDSLNIRNQSHYGGNYPATYSFENEIDGDYTANPTVLDFVDSGHTSDTCTISIENNYKEHYKVLKMVDDTVSGSAFVKNYFDGFIRTSEIIDFWILTSDATAQFGIEFYEGATWVVRGYIKNEKLAFYNGTDWNYSDTTILDDTWYYIKLEFNDITNQIGLVINRYDEGLINYYTNSVVGIDEIRFTSIQANNLPTVYLDAIGYSWDGNYTTDYESEGTGSIPLNFNKVNIPSITVETALGSNVIEMYDNDNSDYCRGYYDLDSKVNKIIEFDIAKSKIGSTDGLDIRLWEGGTMNVYIELRENDMRYYDGSYHYIDENFLSVDTFYTIKLVINDSANTFDVYIDDVLELDNGNFLYDTAISSDKLYFETWSIGIDYYGYIDDLSIIGEGFYEIGDNLFPLLESNNSLEVDKFEFVFEGVGDVHETGDDNPNGWIDVEDGGDVVSTVNNGDDGWIYWITPEETYSGIKKEDFNLHGDIIEIDFEFQPLYFAGGSSGYTTFMISSYDTSGLVGLRLFNDGVLGYFNGVDYTTLRSDIAINTVYDMNLYICFEFELCFMDLYIDGVFDDSYDFELVTTGKEGLDTIDITSLMVLEGDSLIFTLNSTAVYSDGVSVAKNYDFGYIEYDLEKPLESWNFEHNNLFNINADGYFAIYSSEGTYTAGDSLNILFSEKQYDSLVLYNLYDDGATSIDNPFLVVFLSDYAFSNISYISIDGIKIQKDAIEYFPTYNSGNIQNNVSYWYVSNNNLNYFLNCDDNETEYIQISFDIDDIATFNTTFMYSGSNHNILGKELRFNFNGGITSIITVEYGNRYERIYYPADYIVISFDILITDDDKYYNLNATGYFTDFIVRYSTEYDIDITTSNFLDALTPLLFFILLPSLLVIYSLNKVDAKDTTREKMFVPVLAIFCFIAYVFAQIELWQLFVAIIGFATLFVSNFLSNKGGTS